MSAAADLQKQCHELLNKLKTNQATLKQSLKLDEENQPSSLENHLETRRTEKKPEYARQKLRSIMKQKKGQPSRSHESRQKPGQRQESRPCPDSTLASEQLAQSSVRDVEGRGRSKLDTVCKTKLTQGERGCDTGPDNDAMQEYFESRTSSSFMEGGTDSFLGAASAESNVLPQPAAKPLTPTSVRRRQIIDKNVHVESKLSETDLRELERDVRGLNFSYSEALAADDTLSKRQPEQRGDGEDHNNTAMAGQEAKEASLAYHKSLLDGGNNRQLNNFIRDTTVKPKSLLNSTQSFSSTYSKQGPGVSFQSATSSGSNGALFRSQAKDRHLLGYDWIAALVQSDAALMDESESYFHELREFRRSNRDECCNDFYMEGPFTLTQSEPPEVEQAIKDTKVQPFTVNERLFTVPVTENLLGEPINKGDDDGRKVEPTKDNPRFVRVSIPRATLQMPYKRRPHRRRSFDASDSCSLTEHCLMGWNAVSPATLPTASGISLSDAVSGINPKHATTLAEAEKAAATFHWPLLEDPRPQATVDSLPNWRKQYLDTTNHFPHPDSTSLSLSASMGGTGTAGRSGNLRQKTSALLDSTYSMMYEMQKAREHRDQEIRRQTGKAAS